MTILKPFAIIAISLFTLSCIGQNAIPTHEVIKNEDLAKYLKEDALANFENPKEITQTELAEYFQQQFANRYYFNWKNKEERLKQYNELYDPADIHESRAKDHMGKFHDSTQWLLPFNYKNEKPVNAYALRHLARSHKMIDIGFQYFNDNKDPKYITYFTTQMRSLNTALKKGEYETIKNGNGVYEAFRSGYRVLNWLEIHNLFLGEDAYTNADQITTIATLLQHGSHLYAKNQKFKSGNHQTKGMSALAMLSILFRDFEGTDKWYELSMQRLSEHLSKEINPDGFQFERTVHYHMSDIENYFYVYQLANISNIKVDPVWEEKLKTLFTTLVKIAYPDKSAPVLQDDTQIPWAEKNDISGTMTLGYILFEDPEIGYFAGNTIDSKLYWFVQSKQLEQLNSIDTKKPSYGSLHFDTTHYYIMREGWNKNDKMMIISAGLDDKKPDHQHGDMLGIQAIAYGQNILPNYQVRYSLADYELFKNSMVKNVALVDNELQGKQYKSNKGGSGFGKFKELPYPKVIAWETNDTFDFFAGNHNGFDNIEVDYSRQVIFLKDNLWIVKDNFRSDKTHAYKQVWQGHYTTEEGNNLLRSSFNNASGCDIYQLIDVDSVTTSGARGKEWSIPMANASNYSFITVIFPYAKYHGRINETSEKLSITDWKVNQLSFEASGKELRSLSKKSKSVLFNVSTLTINGVHVEFATVSDVFVDVSESAIIIQSLNVESVNLSIKGSKEILIDSMKTKSKSIELKPASTIKCSF